MAQDASVEYELVITETLWNRLSGHLFPGDRDEHGAIIAAGVAKVDGRVRLLARELFLATDGVDYVPGQRGYRMLTAEFVRDKALFCRDEQLAYLAIHNHRGRDFVAFSPEDMQSHERGYPALRDITRGQIVGGLVFAENAVAGDLWLSDGRSTLTRALVLGRNFIEMRPSLQVRPALVGATYDRQARVFGDRGQALLANQRVAIVGLGGIGSLVCEYLSRLGVGSLVLVDPDRLEVSNISRVVGSMPRDARARLALAVNSEARRNRTALAGRFKVDIARREALRANPAIEVLRHRDSVVMSRAALELASCDYIFLAADSMQARLVFNSVVHQYFIPGVQLGTKVPVERNSGKVGRIYSVVRPVLPGRGCLWCNGLITASGLQEEALTEQERRAQRYVEEDDLPAPSVITLNALAAAHGVNDYLFRLTGLREASTSDDYVYIEPRTGNMRFDTPRLDEDCPECGSALSSRLARGDARSLPTR